MSLVKKVYKSFKDNFNEEPYIFRSPGRVNLIGEHTDYNFGFVLPASINKIICLAVSPRNDDKIKIFALDMNDFYEGSINNLEKSSKHWPNYLLGVIDQLKKSKYGIKGMNCVFGGDIPIGAGLSSSAALEAGFAFAYSHIFDLQIDKLSIVRLSQKAENDFVGVNCGIMDQYVNIFGETGKALRIDCLSLEKKYYPFDYKNTSIVLFDTSISHSLSSSQYNQRKKECDEGVKIINKNLPNVKSLRDVSIDILTEFKNKMEAKIFKRCKYVVEENERVLKACEALTKNNLNNFGSLMYETHSGLADNYEVSCSQLDFLVNEMKKNAKVYGARMMGGGFGGCSINIIENDEIESLSRKTLENYKRKFNLNAKVYVTKISRGTSIIREIENAAV